MVLLEDPVDEKDDDDTEKNSDEAAMS